MKNYTRKDWIKFWHSFNPQSHTQAIETAEKLWKCCYAKYKTDPNIKGVKYSPMGGQKLAVIEQLATLLNNEGNLLIGQVGSGKTIVYGFLLYILKHSRYFDWLKLLHPSKEPRIPFMVITRTGVVTQTKRELIKHFGLKSLVMGYPALRSKVGTELFIDFKTIVKEGEPQLIPVWKKDSAPLLILWDECQSLKNATSQQTEIMRSYALLQSKTAFRSIFISATPWERSGEAVSVIIGLRIKLILSGFDNKRNLNWDTGANPSTPTDVKQTESLIQSTIGNISLDAVSPSANKRLQGVLDYNIVRIKNMRYKFKGLIQPRLITPTDKQLDAYKIAFDEYQHARIRAGKNALEGFNAVLVAMNKFKQRAELLRASNLSKMILEALDQNLTPGCACSYLDTLRVIHVHLTRAGIDPKLIANVTGGQTPVVRQDMIDSFQQGDRKIMLFSLGAGGAGLSLHHDSTLTNPRYGVMPVTWSGIDIIQGLGRLHRLTSISPTLQDVCLFRGTIEESKIYPLLMRKKDSISELVKSENEFTKQWVGSDDSLANDIKEHYASKPVICEDDEFNVDDFETDGMV